MACPMGQRSLRPFLWLEWGERSSPEAAIVLFWTRIVLRRVASDLSHRARFTGINAPFGRRQHRFGSKGREVIRFGTGYEGSGKCSRNSRLTEFMRLHTAALSL